MASALLSPGSGGHPRGPEIDLAIETGGRLLLGLHGAPRVDTGDTAARLPNGGLRITPSCARVHPRWWATLESWTDRDWTRRTGHVWLADRPAIQLREGTNGEEPVEVRFFEWAERFGFSWLAKPTWSSKCASTRSQAAPLHS